MSALKDGPLLDVSVVSSFTATPLGPYLSGWLDRLGWPHTLHWSDAGQVLQHLLDPKGALRATDGIVVVLARRGDLGDEPRKVLENAQHLANALQTSVTAAGRPHVVVLTPTRPASPQEAADDEGVAAALRQVPGVDVVDGGQVAEHYPVATIHDAFADEQGQVPYTDEYFAALGTMITRRIRALLVPPKKAILVDCDDTLWGGICGEVGTEGVVIDEPRLCLQRFLLAQRERGMLLCVVSRNNEADALAVFERPEMLVRREHLTTWRIDWSPKSANVQSIAAELAIGIDSLVLLDDDAYVCAEATERCPGLVALQLPADPSALPAFLRGAWVFDRAKTTAEDRRRADAYRLQAERQRAQSAVPYEQFLATLELAVDVEPMAEGDVARVAQLLYRTNQFNATGRRRTEGEVAALASTGLETFVVRVRDRFGDYGATGAVIARVHEDCLVVDAFVLSCRVLGRGVEHAVVRQLAALATTRGLPTVTLPFVATAKNAPYCAFFESLPTARSELLSGAATAVGTTAALAELRYQPGSLASAPVAEAREPLEGAATAAGRTDRLDHGSVARDLAAASAIASAFAPMSAPAGNVVDETSVEGQVSAIWRAVLGRTTVGRDEDLFEMGGDSLVALRILTRVLEQFGVEIPLHRVFQADATVAWMAEQIRSGSASRSALR